MQACSSDIGETTSQDQVEPLDRAGGDVDRESMGCYPMSEMYAYRSELVTRGQVPSIISKSTASHFLSWRREDADMTVGMRSQNPLTPHVLTGIYSKQTLNIVDKTSG